MPKPTILINVTAVRAFVLHTVAEIRQGWPCTRVSQEALDAINEDVRQIIRRRIHQHPSVGKTFTNG